MWQVQELKIFLRGLTRKTSKHSGEFRGSDGGCRIQSMGFVLGVDPMFKALSYREGRVYADSTVVEDFSAVLKQAQPK